MAVGGTWQSQNKVRPGAYINFVGTPKSLSSVGARGIVAAPLSLSWGAQIIEMVANDLVTGASLEKAGVLFTDDAALNLRLLLQSCSKAVIYRLNAETATKATKTAGGLKFTAKHGGTFGNKIAVDIAVKTESGGEGGGSGTPAKAHGQYNDLTVEAVDSGDFGNSLYVSIFKYQQSGSWVVCVAVFDGPYTPGEEGSGQNIASGNLFNVDSVDIPAQTLNGILQGYKAAPSVFITFSGSISMSDIPAAEGSEDALWIHLEGGAGPSKAYGQGDDLTVKAVEAGENGNKLRVEIYEGSALHSADVRVLIDEETVISGTVVGDEYGNVQADALNAISGISEYVVFYGEVYVEGPHQEDAPVAEIELSGGSDGGSGGGSDVIGVTVKTYVNGSLKATGKCAETETVADELGNDWVDVEGNFEGVEAGRYALEGGADGEEVTDISAALDVFENYKFNILAIPQTGSTTKAQAVQWVEGMRKDKGVKVQCVLSEYAGDSEAVISTWQGYTLEDGTAISKAQTVLAVASMEAGAAITESLTGAVIPGAIAVADAPTKHDDIVEALEAGKLILSRRDDGMIVIEKDQNTLHTFTPTHGYIFSKNRPLRVLDQIGNDIKGLFNKNFLGKVGNDDEGREIFKNDLVAYFRQLEGMGAIQNFRPDDVLVLPGNDSDSVVVQLYVQPVDSMEKLYLTVFVEG